MTPAGLLLCDDLLLYSKVTGVARAHDLSLVVCRDSSQLAAKMAESMSKVIILDLHNPTLDLSSIAEWKARGVRVVGFGSHVAKETLVAARQAGCDPVLPRSRFFNDLEALLPVWMS